MSGRCAPRDHSQYQAQRGGRGAIPFLILRQGRTGLTRRGISARVGVRTSMLLKYKLVHCAYCLEDLHQPPRPVCLEKLHVQSTRKESLVFGWLLSCCFEVRPAWYSYPTLIQLPIICIPSMVRPAGRRSCQKTEACQRALWLGSSERKQTTLD